MKKEETEKRMFAIEDKIAKLGNDKKMDRILRGNKIKNLRAMYWRLRDFYDDMYSNL